MGKAIKQHNGPIAAFSVCARSVTYLTCIFVFQKAASFHKLLHDSTSLSKVNTCAIDIALYYIPAGTMSFL